MRRKKNLSIIYFNIINRMNILHCFFDYLSYLKSNSYLNEKREDTYLPNALMRSDRCNGIPMNKNITVC